MSGGGASRARPAVVRPVVERLAMIVHGEGEALVPAHLHFGRLVLERMRRADPERTCLHHLESGARLSYGACVQYVSALAAALARLGVRRGDTVVVAGEPRPPFLPAGLAVLLAGAAYTPIELVAGRAFLAHKLNLTKPKYVICSRLFWEAYRDILQGSEFIETLISFEPVEGIELCVETLVSAGEGGEAAAGGGARGDDTALVLFSSGTTGLRKGVPLSHLNCLTNCDIGVQESNEIETAKSVFMETEMCNSYGAFTAFNCLLKGKTFLYSENKADLNILQDHQVDVMMTSPFAMEELVCAGAGPPPPSLRLLISAGAGVSPAVVEAFQQRFPNVMLVDMYGSTETGTVASGLLTDRGGRVIRAGVSVKVVDVESRALLGPGQVGEICVRGPALFKGYLDAPSPADRDEQGFFPTGDLGYCDERGRLRVVDRLKDVIACENNRKVRPGELEAVLLAHEAVRAAAVVGAPAPGRAAVERPAAFVVVRPGAAASPAQLQAYVDQQVTWYMRLTGGVRLVPALPRTRTGKVLRRRLREMLREDTAAV